MSVVVNLLMCAFHFDLITPEVASFVERQDGWVCVNEHFKQISLMIPAELSRMAEELQIRWGLNVEVHNELLWVCT